MPSGFLRKIFIFSLLSLIFTACQGQPAPEPTPLPGTLLPPVVTPAPPTATATLPPKPQGTLARTLVVCLGQEPSSLYIYGPSSLGMWSVLEAVYDGPVDNRGYTPQPVILTKIPSLAEKDASFEPVEVKAGDLVVNANGEMVTLAAGVRLLPSGCKGGECAQAWDGKTALKLDRMKVTFKLLPGLKWSDGAALTAADSVYSYNLAADPASKTGKRITDRTESYTARDATGVEWVGRPGFAPQRLEELFYSPLPQHAWEKFKPAELAAQPAAARTPLGWGPYVIQEWKPGANIRLARNPNYFRAGEGLPKFDTLVYRFLGEPGDNNLAALMSGECDLIDQTTLVEGQLKQILDLQAAKKLKASIGQGPTWEQLSFGIRPASYDDGFTPGKDRPDFFGDPRVRQAVTECIDRGALVQQLLLGQSSVLASYLPPGHPLLPSGLNPLPYDPAGAARLLDQAGWKGDNQNPTAPRVARGVANVPDGTTFAVRYVTTPATLRRQIADRIAQNLAACGVKVNVETASPADLFAPGPEGVLFGRKFDLAEFSWDSANLPPCGLFESGAIPGGKNNWTGGNLTGFTSAAYDAACQKARQARLDSPELASAYQQTANLVAKDLPVVPLYAPIQVALSRPDLCNLKMDVSARSVLWNIEALDVNETCRP